MKHVFIIHSHTTFLIALSAIKKEILREDDIIFLYGRNYTNSIVKVPYKIYCIDDIYSFEDKHGIKYRLNPFYQYRHIHNVDRFVKEKIGEDFAIYVPHIVFRLFQILVTNPLCKQINLIQESGVTFMNKRLTFNSVISNFLTFFSQRIWYKDDWLIPLRLLPKMNKTFSLNIDYFSKIECKEHVLVKFPQINISLELDTTKPIYLLEASAEHKCVETNIFLEGCRYMIEDSKHDLNYIKFHPGQSKENREKILSFFGNSVVKERPSDVPFELILGSFRNLKLYGFTTSLLGFGKNLDHEVHSYADYLIKNSKKYADYVNSMS